MQSTRPTSKRPPFFMAQQSSSTSLRGLEQSVPSFRAFVNRTPPPCQQKPLPPIPTSSQPDEARVMQRRRTSSVYSRTTNQRADTPDSRHELAVDNSEYYLQPNVYSYSSPHLPEAPVSSEVLRPLAYNPLSHNPPVPDLLHLRIQNSVDYGLGTMRQNQSKISERLDVAVTTHDISGRSVRSPSSAPPATDGHAHGQVRTISLEKAKARMHFRGNQPLLPEEIRASVSNTAARTNRKSRSVDSLRARSGFERAHQMPSLINISDYKTPFLRPAARQAFRSGPAPSSANPNIPRRDSDNSVISFEPRGRTTERWSDHESMRFGPPKPAIGEIQSQSSIDPQTMAENYTALIRRDETSLSRQRTSDSIEVSHQDIRLVPQPLFFNPRQISEQRARQYSQKPLYSTQRSAKGPASTEAKQLSARPQTSREDIYMPPESRSRSGSIPISPPLPDEIERSPKPDPRAFIDTFKNVRADSPHLYQRPGPASSTSRPSIATATSGSTIASTGSSASYAISPGQSWQKPSKPLPHHMRRQSDGRDNKRRPSAADTFSPTIGKSIRAVRNVFGNHTSESPFSSPNDLESAYTGQLSPAYVSRSERRESEVVEVKTPRAALPALDLAMAGLRKMSVVADIIDHRRESKANRRREELKKMIRVIPDPDA